LASENALLWDFPGSAVAVPLQIFSDQSFQDNLSAFFQQATLESIERFSAITHKAQAPLPEVRDTTDPALISGLLIAILEAGGTGYVLQRSGSVYVTLSPSTMPTSHGAGLRFTSYFA
jgi:hypothetical protein